MIHLTSAYASLTLVNAASLKFRAPRQCMRSSLKYVVAHHIVRVTAAYTVDDWKMDISLARANGIDEFALNIGNDTYTPQQVENAFQAAEQLDQDFKVFFSFDISSGKFPWMAVGDAEHWINNFKLQFASRPNQLQVDGKALVSTFEGFTFASNPRTYT